MIKLSAKPKGEKNAKDARKNGLIPAVFYGHKLKSTSVCVDEKEFLKIYKEAGESTLVSLNIEGQKSSPVLISDTQEDPLSGKIIHIDFYHPNLKEKVEAEIPLIFVGESPAVKDMEGTLVKNMSEVQVKALPEDLPHDIKVDVSGIKTFEDIIQVKDLQVPGNVEIVDEEEWTVAMVSAPEDVEKELEKSIDDTVDEVEVVDEKGKEEDEKDGEEEVEGKEEK